MNIIIIKNSRVSVMIDDVAAFNDLKQLPLIMGLTGFGTNSSKLSC